MKLTPFNKLSDKYKKTDSCIDCFQFAPKHFMILDRLWKQITSSKERRKVCLLCLSCTIKRLGRPIKISDLYKNTPVNQELIWSLNCGKYWII